MTARRGYESVVRECDLYGHGVRCNRTHGKTPSATLVHIWEDDLHSPRAHRDALDFRFNVPPYHGRSVACSCEAARGSCQAPHRRNPHGPGHRCPQHG